MVTVVWTNVCSLFPESGETDKGLFHKDKDTFKENG
jgi:hypothetical protein